MKSERYGQPTVIQTRTHYNGRYKFLIPKMSTNTLDEITEAENNLKQLQDRVTNLKRKHQDEEATAAQIKNRLWRDQLITVTRGEWGDLKQELATLRAACRAAKMPCTMSFKELFADDYEHRND